MRAVPLLNGSPNICYITDQASAPARGSKGGDLVLQHGLQIRNTPFYDVLQSWKTFTVGAELPPLDLMRAIFGEEGTVFAGVMYTAAFNQTQYDLRAASNDFLRVCSLGWTPSRPGVGRDSSGRASRDVHFLCHSLGGLIVKGALVQATVDSGLPNPKQKELLGQVRSVVFCGTPHKGSVMANMGSVLRAASPMLRVLRKDNPDLQQLEKDFAALLKQREEAGKRIHILGIVEGLPVLEAPGMSDSLWVVDRESASAHANDLLVACSSTHNTVQRLEKDSIAYLTVQQVFDACQRAPVPADLPSSLVSSSSLLPDFYANLATQALGRDCQQELVQVTIAGGSLQEVTEAAERAGLQAVGSRSGSLQIFLILNSGEPLGAIRKMMGVQELRDLDFQAEIMSPARSYQKVTRLNGKEEVGQSLPAETVQAMTVTLAGGAQQIAVQHTVDAPPLQPACILDGREIRSCRLSTASAPFMPADGKQVTVFEVDSFDGVGILVIPGYVPILISVGKFAEHADWGGVLDEKEGQKVTALFTADVRQALGEAGVTEGKAEPATVEPQGSESVKEVRLVIEVAEEQCRVRISVGEQSPSPKEEEAVPALIPGVTQGGSVEGRTTAASSQTTFTPLPGQPQGEVIPEASEQEDEPSGQTASGQATGPQAEAFMNFMDQGWQGTPPSRAGGQEQVSAASPPQQKSPGSIAARVKARLFRKPTQRWGDS